MDHLLERHGLRGVRVYRNKESSRLVRFVEEEQRRQQYEAAAKAPRHQLAGKAPPRRAAAERRPVPPARLVPAGIRCLEVQSP